MTNALTFLFYGVYGVQSFELKVEAQ